LEITLPDLLPVMTLATATLFPQAVLPLRIFEPRYRQMLRETLEQDRIFAIASLDPAGPTNQQAFEPPRRVAGAGIIRVCHHEEDGTSRLLLQGICRIEILRIVRESPYRLIEARPLPSIPGATPTGLAAARRHVLKLMDLRARLSPDGPPDVLRLLQGLDDPEMVADLAASSIDDDAETRQQLLEITDTAKRLACLASYLQQRVDALKVARRLQGNLPDSSIETN
jgi:Lon protease-like protein